MTEFQIEDDIAIPGKKAGLTNSGPWPWPKMKISQSVFIPALEGETGTTIRRRVNPHAYARRWKKKFATRWMEQDGKFGLRVWRVQER